MALRHLISPTDVSPDERLEVLDRARFWKASPLPAERQNLRVGALYFNSSLRTRVSFEQAVWQLGGNCQTLNAGADTWQMEMDPDAVMDGTKVENIVEAAGVLGRYFHLLGIRSFAGTEPWASERTEPVLSAFARYANTPIISLEGAVHHPCQGLADELTLHESFGESVKGLPVTLCWAWHPNPLPTAVPNTFALQAALAGCCLTIAHPPGYDLDPDVMASVRSAASASCQNVTVTNDMSEGLRGANVVYVKSWGRLDLWHDKDAERAQRSDLRSWRLDHETWALTEEAKVMHCLPVRRNLKISGDLLDSRHSLILNQAENRLWAQAGLVEMLAKLNGRLP